MKKQGIRVIIHDTRQSADRPFKTVISGIFSVWKAKVIAIEMVQKNKVGLAEVEKDDVVIKEYYGPAGYRWGE